YTFVEVDPEIESVRLPSGITWFKIFNDGTDTVVKNIKVADNKGVETVYTFTVNFVTVAD
ncbi:MAG: hypothetical protein PUC29_00300, partial [Clostridia bacterium]|nr:hypothetical protein [Clostridia bacterium]